MNAFWKTDELRAMVFDDLDRKGLVNMCCVCSWTFLSAARKLWRSKLPKLDCLFTVLGIEFRIDDIDEGVSVRPSSIAWSLDTNAVLHRFHRGRRTRSMATGIGSTSTRLSSNAWTFVSIVHTVKFMRNLPNVPGSASRTWSIFTWRCGPGRQSLSLRVHFKRLFKEYGYTVSKSTWFQIWIFWGMS
jgi:hypothetical protein